MTDHKEGCACCGEISDEMYLHSKCHTGAPMKISMNQAGILTVRCAKCEAVGGQFQARLIGEPRETLQ